MIPRWRRDVQNSNFGLLMPFSVQKWTRNESSQHWFFSGPVNRNRYQSCEKEILTKCSWRNREAQKRQIPGCPGWGRWSSRRTASLRAAAPRSASVRSTRWDAPQCAAAAATCPPRPADSAVKGERTSTLKLLPKNINVATHTQVTVLG